MATVRSFLAMQVSPAVVAAAQGVIRTLSGVEGPAVRWVEPDQMHITLKFFGDIAPELTSDICRSAQEVLDATSSFEIQVAGVGAFPHVDRPRTIWAGVTAGGEPLSDLVERLETALEPMGFPRERRRFHPHLTLGRVKGRGSLEALSSRITKLGDEHELGIAVVDGLLLMSSELKPSGPVYTRMATLEFGS